MRAWVPKGAAKLIKIPHIAKSQPNIGLFHPLQQVVGGNHSELPGLAEVGERLTTVPHPQIGETTVVVCLAEGGVDFD